MATNITNYGWAYTHPTLGIGLTRGPENSLTFQKSATADIDANGMGQASGSANLTYNNTTSVLTLAGSMDISENDSTLASLKVTQTGTGDIVQIIAGSTEVFTILKSGNVGIGQAAPTEKLHVNGNLLVEGDLTINGSTTTVNSTTITVDDPTITLGGDVAPSSDDNKDRGIEFRWHNGSAAKVGFFGYDDSTSRFAFIPDATNTSEVFSGNRGEIEVGGIRISDDGSAFGIQIGVSNDNEIDTAAGDLTLDSAGGTVIVDDNLQVNGNLIMGSADISEAEMEILDGATVTTAELNIMDGNTSAVGTTIADGDRVVLNDDGTMVQATVQELAAYLDDEITAMPNLVTTAATAVGTIGTGVWQGTAIADAYISSAATWNSTSAHSSLSDNPHSVTKAQVGLGSVENTAISTWAGTANITSVGTIGTGVWQGTIIADAYIESESDWNSAYTHISNAINPHGVTKAQVGLANVENVALSTWAGTSNIVTVGTLGSLTVTNAITATAFTGSLSGNATSATTAASATTATTATTAGTVTTAAQTNITSVGTLTALTVSGDLTVDTNTLYIDSADNRVGIGMLDPNELLTVEGVASLRETSAPSSTANYGKIYVKSSDSKLYFMNDSGAETNLTTGSGAASGDFSHTAVDGTTYASSNYNVTVSDYLISVITKSGETGNTIEIRLPSASGNAGKSYVIKDTGNYASTQNIAITTADSSEVEGASSHNLTTNRAAVQVYSNGSNWAIF